MTQHARVLTPEEYIFEKEPYYEPVGEEISVFEAAWKNGLPVLLKGPTGCGKTRFMEHMAWRLQRPLLTVSCHDDLTASDLVGRFLVKGGETVWVDGPLARAVRNGSICYLDEVVEARKDTTVVIHPLADDRRVLPMEKIGELLEAPPEFCLAMSYNPGYQSVLKDLKQSTRQRFVALEFDYPDAVLEQKIIEKETGIDGATARQLVKFAQMTRNLKGQGLDEGASTRQRFVAPSEPTFRRVLQQVDPVALEQAFSAWVQASAPADEPLAIDGKTLKGARRGDGRQTHLLAALFPQQGTVLAQRAVEAKSNEIPALRELLAPLSIEGRVVTADALHTQRETARFLVEEKGAHYLFTVKDNQKTLANDLKAFDWESIPP